MNKKYALCVGINYVGTNNQLSGCVNDAMDWTEHLGRNGYTAISVVDAYASRERILAELEALVARAGYGDRIVFTYSGHGTWVPDQDFDESDHRDEALCPNDFLDSGLIIDDEIQRIFAKTKLGVGALFLSDSCHSGTVSRFVLTGVVSPGKARFIPPSSFLPISEERATELEAVKASVPRKTTSLISGCADTEYSYDAWFRGRANGAFTRAAIDTYRAGATLSQWFEAIRKVLPNDSYPQSPQLTAQSSYRKYLRAL